MITLLIILVFIAVCLIYTIQFQITNDYKPYRYVTWDGLLDNPQNPRFRHFCMKWQYSIFSLKDYID